ncbi:hypothetical protein M8J75_004190 [Diaphorina citri]|nr:hypothetical protein M8J75_004190 [Diaphorina citri]
MSDPNVGTSMELAQEDPGGPLRKPPETTTLSTIAVRSGSTRIVIALLQSYHFSYGVGVQKCLIIRSIHT